MKQTLVAAALLLGAGLFAQEGPKISSAIIEFDRNKDTTRAKKYIQEAADIINNKNLSEVRSKDLSKFYYYQGKINLSIAQSNNPEIKGLDANALEEAANAFEKLIDLEKKEGKERYTDGARASMFDIANAYINKGVEANAAKDFGAAYANFYKAYDFKKNNDIATDTTMLYNAALMAQSAKDYPNAIKTTKQLIDMKYRGVQYKATNTETGEVQEFPNRNQMMNFVQKSNGLYVDPVVEGDLRPDLYVNLANLYKTTGDTVKYDAVVAEGRTMFPGNKSLLLLELQKYLDTKQYEKAMVNLEQAMTADPTNDLYPYLQGYIYQTEVKDYEKAKAAYQKAIAINPDKIEPQYMSGLLFVDKANAITEKMNGLNLNEKSKYDKLQKEQQEAFKNALPYFEKAREIDPNDMDTLKALKEVYYKLKMYQEAKDVQAKIDAKG
jgi:tetratricopeptide (TPR) repeat protein